MKVCRKGAAVMEKGMTTLGHGEFPPNGDSRMSPKYPCNTFGSKWKGLPGNQAFKVPWKLL
jgi:hypothetical protein